MGKMNFYDLLNDTLARMEQKKCFQIHFTFFCIVQMELKRISSMKSKNGK